MPRATATWGSGAMASPMGKAYTTTPQTRDTKGSLMAGSATAGELTTMRTVTSEFCIAAQVFQAFAHAVERHLPYVRDRCLYFAVCFRRSHSIVIFYFCPLASLLFPFAQVRRRMEGRHEVGVRNSRVLEEGSLRGAFLHGQEAWLRANAVLERGNLRGQTANSSHSVLCSASTRERAKLVPNGLASAPVIEVPRYERDRLSAGLDLPCRIRCLDHLRVSFVTRANGPPANLTGRVLQRTRTAKSTSETTRPASTTGRVSATRSTHLVRFRWACC